MISPNEAKKSRLAELLDKARAELALKNGTISIEKLSQTVDELAVEIGNRDAIPHKQTIAEKESTYEWNKEQQQFFSIAEAGKSCCLIGKAGTGKTSSARECIKRMQRLGSIGPIRQSTKWLVEGLPGIAVVSFTNRAVKNIAKGMPEDIARHTLTVHKLLEFGPTFFDVTDANGETRTSMKFEPHRNRFNPLPSSLKLIIVEESSMIGTDLYAQLMEALPHGPQFIFLGDLQQLPPVFGPAILGFKLNELPVIELTRIYRQAAGSPIIDLAHRVSRGEPITAEDYKSLTFASGGKLTLRPWKKRLDAFGGLHIMNLLFKDLVDNGQYDPREDMIMIPFNKGLGTTEFNLNLAQHLGSKRKAVVYQIIGGMQKYYYAVGDKILCDREEAIIEEIRINDAYHGKLPMPASDKLNRWGMYEIEHKEDRDEISMEDVDELMLRALALDKEDEEAKQQASHILICRIIESDEVREVRSAGEFAATVFAYALTVHKCQGSEWRKCFVILHNSHATMLSRELVYTAITRAREELVMILEPDTLVKTVKNQRIKGDTIKEKAEFFKGKQLQEKML